MLKKVIIRLLESIITDLQVGNSNITDEEALKIAETINLITRKDEGISKYSACLYLNISRATFDNYVREGKLPRGLKRQGFKELVWYKKDLDLLIKQC